jgi:hypothetical protein
MHGRLTAIEAAPRAELPENATDQPDTATHYSSHPQANEPGQQQWTGTILLDESSLGRWIVNHLAKQLARPAAGTTGIDPRVSAIHAGAPLGA